MFKKMIGLLLSISIVGLVACGSNDGNPQRRAASSVEGFAVDAQIVSGTVTIYAYKDGVKGEVIGSTITDEKGFYSLDFAVPDQHILIEVKGGSYIEEASGESVSLKSSQVLRAVTFYRSGTSLSLMVTPYTNLAAGLVAYKVKEGSGIENAVTEATSAISTMAGVDVLTTVPHNITDIDNVSTTFTPELKYGFMAAAISSWTAEASVSNGADIHAIWNSIALSQVMYRDISEDGLLDGKGLDSETGTVLDLGFGLVSLDANSYRSGFARHLMGMVGSAKNKTGVTLSQAVTLAEGLGGLGHPIFGGLSPEPIDSEGPIITPAEAEGLFHNGVFTFTVNVSDVVGLKSVVFDIDGEDIDQALDPGNPTVLINTSLYLDGEYQIGVRATDNLRNESYRTFRINFANEGTVINVLSPTTVNSSPAALFGNYIENGQGIQSITVNGLPAALDIENKTWSVDVPLVPPNPGQSAAFVRILPVIVTDSLGTQTNAFITMTMDTIPPSIDPLYSNATFISDGQVFTQKLSFAESSNIPIRIETDKVSLNGTAVLEGPLNQQNIPYIRLHVDDPNINGVFTQDNEIKAQLQYSLDGSILTPWRDLPLIFCSVCTLPNYRFIVPLVSEFLHENWHQATPLQEHFIEVSIKDKAGNTAVFTFKFFVEFVPKQLSVTSLNINSFNKSFQNRLALNPARVLATEYKLLNDTGFPVFFSVSDSAVHNVTRNIEEMVRQHIVRQTAIEEYQQYSGNGTWSESQFRPHPTITDLTNEHYSDALPPVNIGSWVVTSIGLVSMRFRPHIISSSISGPLNRVRSVSDSNNFQTQGFEIYDDDGFLKLGLQNWYTIPPDSTYTIKKFVHTPNLPVHNDLDVANINTFSSYTPRRYDKSIQWAIDDHLKLALVHDVGFERINDMVQLNTEKVSSMTVYTVSR